MSYALENALTQWEEGERRVRDAPEPDSADLERAVVVVQDELRRRLGSRFLVGELADLYSQSIDWAEDLAQRSSAGTDTATVVDAAFARYARVAADFAGGRRRHQGAG
ncbi:MAG: hypothetical protein WKF29_02545 [Thermoleophilaceae bacterium]